MTTARSAELGRLNQLCAVRSGMPDYPALNQRRRKLMETRPSVLACLPTPEHVEELLQQNARERSTLRKLLKLAKEALAPMDGDGEGTSANGSDGDTDDHVTERSAAKAT